MILYGRNMNDPPELPLEPPEPKIKFRRDLEGETCVLCGDPFYEGEDITYAERGFPETEYFRFHQDCFDQRFGDKADFAEEVLSAFGYHFEDDSEVPC